MNYPVNNIYPCIQGEGVKSGIPMVMLRLHGCEVGCPFCDTKETWDINPLSHRSTFEEGSGQNPLYTTKTQSEINHYIVTHYPNIKWVLISGGEPAILPLSPLVNALHDGGKKVALETSGTEIGHIDAPFDWVCVSPKIDMPGGKIINPLALTVADEIKHVIGKQSHIPQLDDLLASVTLKEQVEICLQPMSQSKRATQLCVQTVQDRGWRLSIQGHKYLNLD